MKIIYLFLLLCGHALADFALQSDVMAKLKNRHVVIERPISPRYCPCWYYWLTAHALIHGGIVFVISAWLFDLPIAFTAGIIEMVMHWGIDFVKCEGWTDPNQDQLYHLICKIIYVVKA